MKDVQGFMYTSAYSKEQAEAKQIDSQLAEVPTKKIMKVLVVNAYLRANAGDAALLSALLDQISEAFPGSEICVAGMDSPYLYADFEGKANLGSVRRWTADEDISRPNRIARKIVAALVALFWFQGPKSIWRWLEQCLPSEPRRELNALRTADLVVGIGGGYMGSKKGIGGDFHIFYVLLPLVLTKRLKKPLVLAPQSYGPFGSEWQKKAVVHALRDIDAVFVREDTSMALLASLGAKPQFLERAVDSAFAFESSVARDWRDELSINSRVAMVGMTAREWLEPRAQAQYEQALSLTSDYIQANGGSRVVLIPQVTANYKQDDDRIVQGRIVVGCISERKPINLTDLNAYRELKSLYGSLDYLIGTRFHSVIFALTSYVPCIAIEYEHKTGGIMRELGLERWVIPIEDVTAECLQSLFDKLVREADSYRAHLHEVIPPYVSQSRTFVTTLKQTVSRVNP